MRVIAINGSPRKEGNTFHALMGVGQQLQESGINFEILQIGNQPIRGCMACGVCAKNRDEKCSITSDSVNDRFSR
jgi:multimeric flavodoxin WrbA